jgi:cytochrome c-type biogenesis protein CcmH/NrfG
MILFRVAPLLCVCALSVACSSGYFGSRPRLETFETVYGTALEDYESGRFQKAEHQFKRAVHLNPRHAHSHYCLGLLYAARNEQELAIVGFERAIELEPQFPEALYNLGTIRLSRGENVAGAALLEAAIQQEPEYVASYVNLGKAYFLIGMPELAAWAYEEALRRDPDNAAASQNLAKIMQAAKSEESP